MLPNTVTIYIALHKKSTFAFAPQYKAGGGSRRD
jgi:hypothetical protein